VLLIKRRVVETNGTAEVRAILGRAGFRVLAAKEPHGPGATTPRRAFERLVAIAPERSRLRTAVVA